MDQKNKLIVKDETVYAFVKHQDLIIDVKIVFLLIKFRDLKLWAKNQKLIIEKGTKIHTNAYGPQHQ